MDYIFYVASKIEPVFYKMVSMSIIASVIGITILIMKKVLGKKISPKWISRIWLIFIISLILPISIKSSVSIYNLFPKDIESELTNITYSQDAVKREQIIKYANDVEEYNKNYENDRDLNGMEIKNNKPDITSFTENKSVLGIVPFVWGFVCIVLFTLYVLTYIVLEIRINKSEEIENEEINSILENCKQKLKTKKKIKLINQKIINMPSIFGIFNIRILINDELLKLSNKEIEYVLMHEISHYKRKDNLLNILITLLRIVYIFNPIVFICLNKVKKDLELATDEKAIIFNDKEEQKEYCKTLVKLATLNSDRFLVQTLCLTDEKKNLERRIDSAKLMNKFKENRKQIVVISLVLMAFIILVLFTRNSEYMSRRDIINLMEKNCNIDNYIKEVTESYYIKNVETDEKFEDINRHIIYKKDNIGVAKFFYHFEEFQEYNYTDLNTNETIRIQKNKNDPGIIYISNIDEIDVYTNITDDIELLKNFNNKYYYSGKEMIEGKKAYVLELTYKNYHSDEASMDLVTSKEKLWIDEESGLLLKRNILLEYPAQNEIIERTVEYKYQFNVVKDEDVEKPNLYDYKDYKIIYPFLEFEEVLKKAKENEKNKKAIEDMEQIDINNNSYRRDSILRIVDDMFVYNICLTNIKTKEYYKFIINYDDNLVRTMETGILDENSNETNKTIIDYLN